jgi:adenylate cyclase
MLLSVAFRYNQKLITWREYIIKNDRIWYRFGINVGDVVIDNGDVFGNTVNIASRLESIADPGGISITHDIFQNIKSLNITNVEYIGNQHLKNISQKIEVYKIIVWLTIRMMS